MTEAIIRIASGDDALLKQSAARFKKAWFSGKP